MSVYSDVLAKGHVAQNTDYAAALHQAKRWVKKHEKWSSPFYWGAFVLLGPN